MQHLYDICPTEKKQYIIEGGKHNDNWTIDKEAYFLQLSDFIN